MRDAEDLRAEVEGLELANSSTGRDLVEQIRAERTNPRPAWLWKTVCDMHKFTEELKSEFFDLFHFNLKEAVTTECMTFRTFIPALVAFRGVLKLGSAYFKTHKDKFTEIWPLILRYVMTVLAGRYVYMSPADFFKMASDIFYLAKFVQEEVLKTDDAFMVAAFLWFGCRAPDKRDHYTEWPLLVCLAVGKIDENHLEYISNLYKLNPGMQVDQILTRIEAAARRSSIMQVDKISRLCFLTYVLEDRCKQTKSETFLSSKTGPYLIGIIDVLLNAPDISAGHMRAAGFCCRVINRCIKLGPAYATQIVQAGVLERLVKVASLEEVQNEAYDALFSISVSLIHEDVVKACQIKLCDQYRGEKPAKELLEKSHFTLKSVWDGLEFAALERSALSLLFNAGYAPELETCANRICDKFAPRYLFKLCSVCGIALYCSHSCQERDWPVHRPNCRKIAKETANTLPNGLHRFAFRMAAVHIARHMAIIDRHVMIGLVEPFDYSRLGVFVEYDPLTFCPRIGESFDYQLFLRDDAPNSSARHQVVANEVLRLKGIGRKSMMVVLRSNGCDVPFTFNMDGHFNGSNQNASGWAKPLSNLNSKVIAASTPITEGLPVPYKGADGALRDSYFVDALRATKGYARLYAVELGEPVWSEQVLDKAVGSVIGEFKEEMRKWSVGGNEVPQ